jgi:PPOX class probable F420-dependent enzyme
MVTAQGNLALLKDPVAQELLRSTHMARLAYTWSDGTPRVVPIWFLWNGDEFILLTPQEAPKLKALATNPQVALSIDSEEFPYKALTVRGTVRIQRYDGPIPETEAIAKRYLGEEGSRMFLAEYVAAIPTWTRLTIRPEWVNVIDLVTRFPSARMRRYDV